MSAAAACAPRGGKAGFFCFAFFVFFVAVPVDEEEASESLARFAARLGIA
jgi:hypothetical protein